jgi:hypothetical protein
MNAKQLAGKIEWEGGLVDALEYGLGEDSLDAEGTPPELKKAWDALVRGWDTFGELLRNVLELLPQADDEETEE